MKREPVEEDGELFWQCSRCKRWLSSSDFYADRRTASQLRCQCKRCVIETVVRTRDRQKALERNRYYRLAKRI